MSISGSPLLLYDGTCGFCARSVQFVLGAERGSRDMVFATLEGGYGDRVREQFPVLRGVDSIVLYLPAGGQNEERVLTRSDAALWVARYVGGVWRGLALVAGIVPRPIRDFVYDFIARHRHVVGADACLLPSASERQRFLDMELSRK
jgi:predicted DCC family thiol-disulfide oxidoreductase YuxK